MFKEKAQGAVMNSYQIRLMLMALALHGVVYGADLETLTENCSGCHGPQGISSDSDIPSIAGQSAEYITGALRSFQEWGRPCKITAFRHGDTSRPETRMCTVSKGLSDEEIESLGEYYGAMAFSPVQQSFDAAKAATGKQLHDSHCESCHPEGGRVAGRGPILAGQWIPYLKEAVNQALSGEHLVPPLMENELMDFSGADIDALVNFYASQQN
jgi:sulfide dehydrogenase cytochrome subunit